MKGKATHSSILAWRIPWTIRGVAKSHTTATFAFTLCNIVRELASLDLEAHGNSCYGAWSVPEILDL